MLLTDDLAGLLRRQSGLASRAQLIAAGVSPSALSWRLGRTWRSVLPGVVATFTGSLTPAQRLIAAQLLGGPDAMLGSWTAAAWHGVESARRPAIAVTVPANQAARRVGFVVVQRSSRVDAAPVGRSPLVIASGARAVVDAARDATADRRALALVVEAVQRRLVTVDDLRHELARAPRQGSRKVRLALQAAEAGSWSVPEVDLLALVGRSTELPEAWPNPVLRSPSGLLLPSPDLWLDDVGLAVQVHSRTYHLRDDDWEGTVSGDTALGEHGIVVLGLTPARIGRDPMAVLGRIERSHRALRGRPRPDVLARPRFA